METADLGQHLLEDVVEHARPDRAVGPHHLDRQLAERADHLGGGPPGERHPVVGEGDLGHDGQVGERPHRLHREPHLGEVGERLDHERVHPALEQPLRLLVEREPRLLGLDAAERRQVLAERPDRAHHEHVAAHALAHVPRELGPAQVDLAHPALEAVRGQLEAVGPEGVGLDQVRAGLDVLGVDRLHDLGLVEVQHVEARVERHPAGIEHGAHRAVAEERALAEAGQERRGHGLPAPLGTGEMRPEREEDLGDHLVGIAAGGIDGEIGLAVVGLARVVRGIGLSLAGSRGPR